MFHAAQRKAKNEHLNRGIYNRLSSATLLGKVAEHSVSAGSHGPVGLRRLYTTSGHYSLSTAPHKAASPDEATMSAYLPKVLRNMSAIA